VGDWLLLLVVRVLLVRHVGHVHSLVKDDHLIAQSLLERRRLTRQRAGNVHSRQGLRIVDTVRRLQLLLVHDGHRGIDLVELAHARTVLRLVLEAAVAKVLVVVDGAVVIGVVRAFAHRHALHELDGGASFLLHDPHLGVVVPAGAAFLWRVIARRDRSSDRDGLCERDPRSSGRGG